MRIGNVLFNFTMCNLCECKTMCIVYVITNKLTDSMTSKKTSFFLYLMPCPLHDTALVKASGGRGATSSL